MTSAYTSTFNRASDLLKKANSFGILTIIGGIFASDNVEYILTNHTYIDIVVIGEGEKTLLQLLNAIYYEKPINEINGIGYRKDDSIYCLLYTSRCV